MATITSNSQDGLYNLNNSILIVKTYNLLYDFVYVKLNKKYVFYTTSKYNQRDSSI